MLYKSSGMAELVGSASMWYYMWAHSSMLAPINVLNVFVYFCSPIKRHGSLILSMPVHGLLVQSKYLFPVEYSQGMYFYSFYKHGVEFHQNSKVGGRQAFWWDAQQFGEIGSFLDFPGFPASYLSWSTIFKRCKLAFNIKYWDVDLVSIYHRLYGFGQLVYQ